MKNGLRPVFEEGSAAVKGRDLHAVDVDMSDTPDAVPTIAVVAAFATGTTRIRNIGHLREKECDRLYAVTSQLEKWAFSPSRGGLADSDRRNAFRRFHQYL